ncbi:hypothetical protein [Qingshengfaniella alkalisoli]|uniref:Uncharacterized protein n=1 Tax=Qingshengfaniella alkalisoli TaxID=2599296 RepID=A0A5B8I8Z7_9RHOB|nr:hypothetical protein [Qingshengfaniella alkalisoli]QDY69316.1 hypothetical protein FPZ52_06520 [Qingshengfaniella alkalisoli]
MNWYSHIRAHHDRLMQRYSQGNVVLEKQESVPGPEPWDPPVIATVYYPLRATVRGIDAEHLDSASNLTMSDLIIQCAVPAVVPAVDDVVRVDGAALAVLQVTALPGAGGPVGYKLVARG